MLIYAVDKQDYKKYKQAELEKISKEVKELQDNQVAIQVKFSKKDRDFSVVDNVLYKLLKEQDKSKEYIKQEELNRIDEALKKIECRDIDTLSEVLWNKSRDTRNVDDILEIINNHKNYMFLYIANEEELGRFIVKNLECYQMPRVTLNNLDTFIDYKEVARAYLYYSNITVDQKEDIILDISNRTDDELIKKLQAQKLDSRVIYDNRKVLKENEEEFE